MVDERDSRKNITDGNEASKKVVYQAEFQGQSLIRTLPDGSQETSPVDMEEVHKLEELCGDSAWNLKQDLSRQIGKQLFDILNGDRQTLVIAIKEAEYYGGKLQLILKAESTVSYLPFELLYHNDFLVPSKMHLIRRVSDRGKKIKQEPENRPLRILFMACSPQNVATLEFEKEEDTILEVTKDLPVEIDVEDTGSLDGLGGWLETNRYDIVHITGHADIENGKPFFCMEDEEGAGSKVTPSQLWEKLDLNMPSLVFLSGCRTGEVPEHIAALSFAQQLVIGLVPAVLGWGLPVTDVGARSAAVKLYHEFSRGENVLEALRRTRKELFDHYERDWSLLRIFSDATPLDAPLVKRGQKKRPKPRELQYAYLENSQVKVLKRGFIGRRRQIQQGLRCLRHDEKKIGLLLHGTGGLGKSCLAVRLCERFKDHTLIVVHGKLDAVTFLEALKHGFIRGNDSEGLKILDEKEEIPVKIEKLCYSAFQNRNYFILLDDFEKNLEGIEEGSPHVLADAVPILEALLRFVPNCVKMTQMIITSRYTFPLTFGGRDMVSEKLESIGLTSFRDADERKKVSELANIAGYPDPEIRKRLIEAGHGNPRLMEYLNTLVGEVKRQDIASLLSKVKGMQEEFVQGLVLRKIMEAQTKDFQTFLRLSAVYRLPVLKEGIALLCGGMKDWESHVDKAIRLSLMEKDSSRKEYLYWVTPLLRESMFGELGEEERKRCHQNAVSYYQKSLSEAYEPVSGAELIEQALNAGLEEIAVEEAGSRFLPYLRNVFAYREGLAWGEYTLSHIPELKKEDKFGLFMSALGEMHYTMGNARKAIGYYEQALSIVKEVYGDRHPNVAIILNNIGEAWRILGEYKKAMEYYEQALSIDKEVYGDRHPDVATRLNNIGLALHDLGEPIKAIEYYGEALSIVKEVYGNRHPKVATTLNNIGEAWRELGEPKKAIDYCEQALSIDKEVYVDRHPAVARDLNNIGLALHYLGEHKKAIEYYGQALSIVKEVYGDKHPKVAATLNNIGSAWDNLGEHKKAIEYYEQALSIDKEVYDDRHPAVATDLNNIGGALYALGDSQRAKEYFQQAYDIFRGFYGDEHPRTKIVKGWLDKLK